MHALDHSRRTFFRRHSRSSFYELQIKQGETYQQFQTTFYAANQKLQFMMKKLRLDLTQEAPLLTATKGELRKDEIAQAI